MEVEKMSRPRSRSPHSRRFPWEESSLGFYKVRAELDDNQLGLSHAPREDPEERPGYFGGVAYPEVQRRSPHFPDDRTLWHQHRPGQEEFYHRKPSPQHDGIVYGHRRASLPHNGAGDGDRCRGGFNLQNFGHRGRSSHSSPRLMKEQYTPTPRSHSDFQPRESERGIGWRREEQDRGHGRVRDPSPSGRSEDQRGRRNTQGPNRDKQREDSHRERNLPFKRQRRQMDDRFRAEEDYVDQRYSVNSPRNSFGGDVDESLPYGGIRHSGPLVIEHDHGITRGGKGFDDPSDLGPDFAWQRSPCPKSSSTDRFRKLDSRLDDWEEARGHRLQDNWRATKNHASKRSMTSQVSTNSMGFGGQNGPMNHRERSGPLSASGIFSEGQGLKTEPHRSQSRLQQSSKGHQGPREGQKLETQPFRDEKPRGGAPRWVQEARSHWRHGRPGSPERHLFKSDIDPSVPCEKVRGWTDQKNTMVEMGETLTIKVDTSQPINKNSLRCYSSERQLSLDLVNVGRQRLDFLPMLEHSGTYHETTVHTGTFAQEIITLVHHVKEQYFRDGGISLNERFSAPPTQSFSEAPTEELTLDQRFSSNRGFSLKTNSLLDDEESLFSRLGSQQPVRGPGDLRHDLERKRQERLECVKVTIAGTRTFQAPPTPHRSSLVIG